MEKSYNREAKENEIKGGNTPSSTIFSDPNGNLISSVSYPVDKTIIAELEEAAAKHPLNIAVVYEKNAITFQELNDKSNQVADFLIKKGITTENLVPFCMEKSINMLVTLFGILKSGGAYVPIDPKFPSERIQYILTDTGAKILLVNNDLAKRLNLSETIEQIDFSSLPIERTSHSNPKLKISPENLAYVIYTSGSTGRPKGVMVPHRGIMDHCYGLIESARLETCKSYAITSPIVFDAGHSLIHTAVIQAATNHLLTDDVILDSEKLTTYLKEKKIDCLKIVPSLWLSHTESGSIPVPCKKLIFGGENFPISILTLLKTNAFQGDVFNHYGPTEATIGKCIYSIDLNYPYEQVPIGKPFSNTFILLLDNNLKTVTPGEVGEIYIGGEGIARGYLNLPEATAEVFIPDFFSGQKGGVLYRTGDLAKLTKDGNILYLGRSDNQVKINGFRIEPGEIEKSIYQYEGIRQIAVAAKTNKQDKVFLVAYYIAEHKLAKDNLKDKLKSRLPAHMIPQYWVEMDEMPLTSRGKIDKSALPEPEWESTGSTKNNPPKTEIEKQLFKIWQKVLGLENIGIQDDFFELGGDSLLVIQSIAAVKKSLGFRLSVRDFFEFPTIASLGEKIGKSEELSTRIEPKKNNAFIPPSYNQESQWIIHHTVGSLSYHIPLAFIIEGALDIVSLRASLKEIVKRHLPLRTVFKTAEKGLEQKSLEAESWSLYEVITPVPEHEIVGDWPFKAMLERPFDLSADYMIRATLFHIQPKKYLLGIVVHHIAWDGWSTAVFKNELSLLYNQFRTGAPNPMPLPVLDYFDFSIFQREQLIGNLYNHSLQYWKKKLDGVLPMQLRTDFPRTLANNSSGDAQRFEIDKDIVRKLKSLAKKHKATLFMVLLAAFNALLKRYSSQEDICVGTPVAGREHEGLDHLIGFFVNSLTIRTLVKGNTKFDDLLDEVKTNTLEAFDHGHVPFGEMVKLSDDFRIAGRNPVFQVLFVLQNNASPGLNFDGLATKPVKVSQQNSAFELTLEIIETQDQLQGLIEYQTALFSPPTIAKMAEHYVELLKGVANDPQKTVDEVNLLNEKERDFVLNSGKEFTLPKELSKSTVIHLIADQVKLSPEKIALSFNDENITYAALDLQSTIVANHLINIGVTPKSFVPICMDNSIQMIVGILGILKAGAAYVPLDPSFPKDRIQFILQDTKASCIITAKETETFIQENFSNLFILPLDHNLSEITKKNSDKPKIIPSPEDTAYLIYTSGTTGKPKGVMVSHRGLFLFLFSRKKYYPESTSISLLSSFTFDASVPVIFGALSTGNTLFLKKAIQLKDPKELKNLLSQTETILCVPSFYGFLLAEDLIPYRQIKRVILAGEKLDSYLVSLHFEKNKGSKLFNEYGPTEATVWATVSELKSPKDPITIGKPISHIKTYVVDELGEICPVGIPGELCISGESLAKGYLNRPDLTASAFVPDPFSKEKNRRMYKTGDKARLLPDGNLEYLGRLDNQVKLRGYRIEPEEIETLLDGLDFVEKTIVTCIGDSAINQKLIAHVVTKSNFESLSEVEMKGRLIAHASDNLPAYMLPSDWNFLNKMPLTAIGKIDRKKLSGFEPVQEKRAHATTFENATEKKLAGIWKELLKINAVGLHDNFFKIGGHSLLAIRLINAIQTHFAYEIKFSEIFKHPTIQQLALLINGKPSNTSTTQPIIKGSAIEELPLSFSQESLWFTDRLEGSLHYHIPLVLKLKGNLHIPSMETALRTIFKRHEVLRTTYQYNGEEIQQVVRDFDNWHLEVKDSSSENLEEEALDNLIKNLINQPFDLANDAMFRVMLVRQSDEQNILVLTFHHIAFDGWSVGLFMDELKNFYHQHKTNNKINSEPMPIQYRDYAVWQREQLNDDGFEKKIDFWKNKLSGVPPIKLGNKKSAFDHEDTSGDTRSFFLPTHLSNHVKELARDTGTTVYMVLMATFKTLLYQLTRQTDICVGTVVADRNYRHTDKLLGYFINTLPIRSQIKPGSGFTDFLQEVKINCLEAFEYQEVPFEKIVLATQPERKLGSNPLFQVMFLLQNTFDEKDWKIDDLNIERLEFQPQRAKFDLLFTVSELDNGFKGLMEYKTALFNSDEINELIEKYLHLLDTLFHQPTAALDVLFKEKEIERTIDSEVDSSGFDKEFKAVQKLIETAASKFSSKDAIISKNGSCTYEELNETSNQLADLLTQKGVGRNDIVGIVMDRSIEMITSIMGVLKAGAAYLPIDTDFPEERISYMLKDAAKVHITQKKYQGNFQTQSKEVLWEDFKRQQSQLSKQNPSPNNEPNDIAYIIYTSGSTGKPKGVVLTHENLYNFLKTVSHRPGITSQNKFLAVSSCSFDIALLELILPFVHGAQIVILDQFERKDPWLILEYLTEKKADIMFATPTHWKMLLEAGWDTTAENLHIISGGEALSKELASQLLPLCHSLWNIYGPTETTVFSTIKKIEADQGLITIGREVLNTNIYILDDNLKPVPKGIEGEIYISGKGVAKGYLNQPELTNEKFTKDPFQTGESVYMYKTGDRAKFLPDGEIQILGRIDNQIKLRGHRIELEEIEQAINRLDLIKESVVLFRNTSRGDKGLVAYLLLQENAEGIIDNNKAVKSTQLKSWKKELSAYLPAYMLPFDFIIVDHFPHTASGKIDRLKLPELNTIDPGAPDQEIVLLPETTEEKKIAAIWKEALGLAEIDITDNFFELGGHSLIAVKVMTRIENESGTLLPLSILFKYPTIQQLAAILEKKVGLQKEWKSIVPIQPKGKKPPIFIVHGAGLNVIPFQALTKYFDQDQPFFGIQSKGMDRDFNKYESVEEIAASYVKEIKENHPSGELILAGFSLGGILAFEMAKQIKDSGISLKKLFLFDTFATFAKDENIPANKIAALFHREFYKKSYDLKLLFKQPRILMDMKKESIGKKIDSLLVKLALKSKRQETPILQRINKIKAMHLAACKNYKPGFYDGEIVMLRAGIRTLYFFDPEYLGWKGLSKSIRVIDIPCVHSDMFTAPNDKKLADIMKQVIAE